MNSIAKTIAILVVWTAPVVALIFIDQSWWGLFLISLAATFLIVDD